MVISETKDLEMLKKMHHVGLLHMKRCLDPESKDFTPDKAAEISVDLLPVKLRIEELTDAESDTSS